MSIHHSDVKSTGSETQRQAESQPTEASPRLQLKRQMAGLSYDEQLALVQPAAPVQARGGLDPGAEAGAGEQASSTGGEAMLHSTGAVQQSSEAEAGTSAIHGTAAQGFAGAAQPLPHLGAIEHSFGGHDVGEVRAHLDSKASKAASRLGATAYASGDQVAFKRAPDLHTAAHEAAHVVQQRQGVSLPGGVGREGDAYERHADAVAESVVAGRSAEGLLSAGPGGGSGGVQMRAAVQPAAVQAGQAVQMNRPKPVHTAETPTASDVPRVDETPEQLAWRKCTVGTKVGWYVVKVKKGEDAGKLASGVHPDEAFSMAANPGAEAAADAFEQAVGNHAMGSGEAKGAAKALADKAVAVTEAYLAALQKGGAKQEQLDRTFQSLLGGMGKSWAGSAAVPIPEDATDKGKLAKANVDRIKAVQASGNVREMVNLGVSFMYQFGKVHALEGKTAEMETFYTEAQAKAGKLPKDVEDFTVRIKTAIEHNKTADKDDQKWVTPIKDRSDVSAQQGSSRIKNPGSDDKSKRKVESLGDYAQLSENEKLVMFGPEAAKEKELKEELLTWSEGRKVWFINEGDTFVQQCREASIPLGGGVSGTTMRIMDLAQVFNTGVAPVDMRAAAIGYLLPIRAHTLIEVMKGAEPFGAGSVPSPPTFAIYANIQPWGDLTAQYGNETLKKLVEQTSSHGD